MDTATSKRHANVTPMSTPPPGPPPSDKVLQTVIAKRDRARIEELELENATLQAKLEEALVKSKCDDERQEQQLPAIATGTDNDHDFAALTQKYHDLEASHRDLEAKLKQQQLYIDKALAKYKAAKESAMQWKAYVDKKLLHDSKAARQLPRGSDTPTLPVPPSLPQDISDIDVTPKAFRQTSHENPATEQQDNHGREQPSYPAEQPGAPAHTDDNQPPPSSCVHSERITSSQTTVDDEPQVDSPPIKHEAGSDEEPVVVREVNLKRRRAGSTAAMPPPRPIKQESESPTRPGSAEEPFELRSEDWSSPPMRSRALLRMETSDLDAMRGTYQTPRKRRSVENPCPRSEERAGATLQPPLPQNSSSLSDSDIPELPEIPVPLERPMSAAEANPTTPRIAKATPQSRSYDRSRGALRPLSPNVATASGPARKRQRVSEGDAGKVSMLAEDGDDAASQVTPKTSASVTKTPASHRLEALLENTTPGRQPLQPRPAPSTTKRTRPRPPEVEPEPQVNTTPKPQPSSHIKPAPSTTRQTIPRGITKPPPPINPASEPLRLKKLEHLHGQHFRINPAHADSTYAYVDPMNRKTKAARRCLPGCIDPQCCGEFLDAARHNLLPPTTKSKDELLEDMLGPSWAEIILRYPEAQHAELLIQARAQEFATLHGKHRKTFERAKTPPGFWRTDMPSTQEMEEDRREAERLQRLKVEGMWREAMRTDRKGRWMFRDEV